MKIINKIWLLALLIVLSVSIVHAETRLNIAVSETVDQNTSFGYNFNYSEGSHPSDYCTITGLVNISNPEPEYISNIFIEFYNTTTMSSNFTWLNDGGRVGTQYNGSAGVTDYINLHIPELLQNNWSAFQYSFACDQIPPPLNVSTTYSNSEFGISQKVLAGHNWTVNQTASNDLNVAQQIRNINISIVAQTVSWNGSSDDFTLVNLQSQGDFANVNTSLGNMSWWWEVNGGTLANPGDSEFIAYEVQAPMNVPTSATYLAIQETLDYEVWYLASNLSISSVRAVGDLNLEFDKQIIQPAAGDNDTNVTWEVRSNISVPYNISYNLTKVTLWVTDSVLLNETVNDSKSGAKLEINYTPLKKINGSTEWYLGPGGDTSAWRFNYSDASTNPPIVWLMPQFTVMDAFNQIVYNQTTVNGTDLYMKYIYVVNGYWLQIDKNITSVDDDTYMIQSIVTNIGTAWTPNSTLVTVYDFVPSDFAVWNMSPSNDSGAQVTNGAFNGSTYRWTIPSKLATTGFDSSLAPMYGPAASPGNATWNVTYYVNGSGTYQVSELYIVGLDPRKVDGAGTHEGITVKNAFSTSSSEMFYIAIVFFLVVINVANFVYTRKINQKLNKHHK